MKFFYFLLFITRLTFSLYFESNDILLTKYNEANNRPFYASKYLYSNHYSLLLKEENIKLRNNLDENKTHYNDKLMNIRE